VTKAEMSVDCCQEDISYLFDLSRKERRRNSLIQRENSLYIFVQREKERRENSLYIFVQREKERRENSLYIFVQREK
jgi:hypothetical protein